METAPTILVVDDEPKIVRVVRAYLEEAGFQVAEAHDGVEALTSFHRTSPGLIVLDLMLPGVDGIEITRRIRKESNVPIIMLTARAEEVDRLVGLELGADDYLVKPFSPRELVARVRAVLRRTLPLPEVAPTDRKTLQSGGVVVHLDRHRVEVDGKPIGLTALQFDLLALLVENADRVFTREQVLEATTGDSPETYERTVDAHIKNLRKALGEDSRSPRFIHTVHGVGYRFHDEHE